MEKTYEFEGRQYRESGEVRCPKQGELFLCYDAPSVAQFTFQKDKCPILTPVETSPRILTGYDPDAKAGDVYNDGDKLWRLVEFRIVGAGERAIWGSDEQNWKSVLENTDGNLWPSCVGPRWIVVPHEPGEESKAAKPATAMADTLTLIANRADSLKETLLAKHQDYGGSVFKRPRFVPKATAREAMLIRLGDKCERLEQLLAGNKPLVNESEDQTLLDVAGYALLLLTERDLCPTT